MASCPSCAGPLDPHGICTACGALARGSFRGLDLGPPQLADAVARGLDFYRLLGVDPAADGRQVARRYRQLRVLFPDDPSGLAPEPARRLALLEVAGRALSDPGLRQVYDELRAARRVDLDTAVRRCDGCTAPLAADARRCPYCGTPVAAPQSPPAAPPSGGPPAAEPVDYYALIGLTPAHLVDAPASPPWSGSRLAQVARRGEEPRAGLLDGPPTADEVDAAAFAREREVLLAPGPAGAHRETRAAEVDLARRILRDERRRARYDLLWRAFQRGAITVGHLEGLRALQDEVRAEAGLADGSAETSGDGVALLRQGVGLLRAGLPREALPLLRAAVAACPNDPEAHAAYVRAILGSADPLDLGAHLLRQALASLEAAAALGPPPAGSEALTALCRGLLARDAGDPAAADVALREAARLDGALGAAWRGLAALALGRGAHEEALAFCRRALAARSDDERALLMAAAACARSGRGGEAREAAARVAGLRGDGWTAEDVLREVA